MVDILRHRKSHRVSQADTAEDSETLPFMLTSAFPYADNVYFFPIPLTFRGNEDTADDLKKKIKKVRFISESIFQDIISDDSP